MPTKYLELTYVKSIYLILYIKDNFWTERNASVVQSTYSSCRGLRLGSQHPHGSNSHQ